MVLRIAPDFNGSGTIAKAPTQVSCDHRDSPRDHVAYAFIAESYHQNDGLLRRVGLSIYADAFRNELRPLKRLIILKSFCRAARVYMRDEIDPAPFESLLRKYQLYDRLNEEFLYENNLDKARLLFHEMRSIYDRDRYSVGQWVGKLINHGHHEEAFDFISQEINRPENQNDPFLRKLELNLQDTMTKADIEEMRPAPSLAYQEFIRDLL